MERVGWESAYSPSELNRIFSHIYESDFRRLMDEHNDEEWERIAAKNDRLEAQIESLGQDVNTYRGIEDAFEVLALDSRLTLSYDSLNEEDKKYLETQALIHGSELIDFLESWADVESFGITEEDINSLDKDKVYSGKEAFNIIFGKSNKNSISEEGLNYYNKMEIYNDDSNPNKVYEQSIKSKLSKIREDSGEYKDIIINKNGKQIQKRKYFHPLNYYWDKMIELNPYMDEDNNYNKRMLFEQVVKELKMYKPSIAKERIIEYDFSKSVAANPRVARNNLIFELMRHRLMDKETLKDRLTPGGFDNNKFSAKQLRHLFSDKNIKVEDNKVDLKKLEELARTEVDFDTNYDAADPYTLLVYNQLNQVAAKLIGVFANQNTNHQLSSLVRRLDLKSPIIFDGMIGAKITKSTENLSGLSEAQISGKCGKSLLNKEIILADGRIVDIDLNLAEFLAAAVDAVKDPVLNYLNFNTITAASGALLARMGYSTRDIGILFNQPIIKDLCAKMQNSNGAIQFNRAKRAVLKKYSGQTAFPKNINTLIESDSLAASIVKFRGLEYNLKGQESLIQSDKSFCDTQIIALKLFTDVYNASRELNQYINTTKYTAANAVGSSSGFFYAQRYNVKKYLEQPETLLDMIIYESNQGTEAIKKSLDISKKNMSNIDDYLQSQMQNPFAFEQCMYDLNVELMNLLNKYYPYELSLYANRRDAVADIIPEGNILDEDTINYIHRETMHHILSSSKGEFNPREICKENSSFTNRDYYLYQFPLDLYKMFYNNINSENTIKSKALRQLYDYINFTLSDITNIDGSIVKRFDISINNYQDITDKNSFIDLWALLATGDEELKTIAKGLFFHNYYRLGFNVGPFSFSQHVPLEVKKLLTVDEVSYLDYISLNNLSTLISSATDSKYSQYAREFSYQFALNHPDNRQLVHSIYDADFSSSSGLNTDAWFNKLFTSNGSIKKEVALDLTSSSDEELNAPFIKNVDKEQGIYEVYPIIYCKGHVYAATINGDYNNITSNGKVVYKKVRFLGKKNVYSTYASTLNEALDMVSSDEQTLKNAESNLDDTLRDTLSSLRANQQQQVTAENLKGMNEFYQAPLTLEVLDRLPVINDRNNDYVDITSLIPIEYQFSIQHKEASAETTRLLDSIFEDLERNGITNAFEYYAEDGSIKILLKEEDFTKLAEEVEYRENHPEESVSSEEGDSGANEDNIDIDIEDMKDRIYSCNKINANVILNTLLDLMEEKLGPMDRDSVGEWLEGQIENEVQSIIKSRKDAGENVSLFAQKVIRKETQIQILVDKLAESIQEGRTDVYTKFTNEKLC